MCGFAGLLRWSGLTADDTPHVRAAGWVLAHRGPDGEGYWQDHHAALAFRRLKIIDLSPAGDQPMCNENGALRIVFNGEIYNYRELRAELQGQGHIFKSRSDTEVLLHLYERDGEEMLPRLRGMFAFALWDAPKRKLFLARDPFGVKPLYFAEQDGALAFASEPKALFALGVKPRLDPVAVDEALTYRYVPAPRTGFQDVEKLPPGHCAAAENGRVSYRRWFNLADWPVDKVPEPHVVEYLGAQLRVARTRRSEADVPIGWWLSGGLDSGLAQPMSKAASFCAGFGVSEYDESELARLTAEHVNGIHAKHYEILVPADIFRQLPAVIWHMDEPFFDSSCLPTYVLAAQTKLHASVVFSGDGGDEAFAGYERYVGLKLLARYTQVPAPLRRLGLAAAAWLQPAASRQGWDRALRWLESCRVMAAGGRHPYLAAMELFSAEQKRAIYGEGMSAPTGACDAREYLTQALLRAKQAAHVRPGASRTDPACAPGVLQRTDLETYLPGDVLMKVDRMSMAHGVEVRSPFLDVDLVAWALSLPDDMRLPGRQTKPLLRQLAEPLLPPEVVGARKRGFGVPLDDWFRGRMGLRALGEFEKSVLVADRLFKPRFWETLWDEHQAERAQHGERLYALLALELWYRMFIRGVVTLQRPAPLAP